MVPVIEEEGIVPIHIVNITAFIFCFFILLVTTGVMVYRVYFSKKYLWNEPKKAVDLVDQNIQTNEDSFEMENAFFSEISNTNNIRA
jgi:hypothetical protein